MFLHMNTNTSTSKIYNIYTKNERSLQKHLRNNLSIFAFMISYHHRINKRNFIHSAIYYFQNLFYLRIFSRNSLELHRNTICRKPWKYKPSKPFVQFYFYTMKWIVMRLLRISFIKLYYQTEIIHPTSKLTPNESLLYHRTSYLSGFSKLFGSSWSSKLF